MFCSLTSARTQPIVSFSPQWCPFYTFIVLSSLFLINESLNKACQMVTVETTMVFFVTNRIEGLFAAFYKSFRSSSFFSFLFDAKSPHRPTWFQHVLHSHDFRDPLSMYSIYSRQNDNPNMWKGDSKCRKAVPDTQLSTTGKDNRPCMLEMLTIWSRHHRHSVRSR